MRGNELLDKIGLIDPAYVSVADAKPKKKKNGLIRWGAIAACLCLIAAGAFILLRPGHHKRAQPNTLQTWNSGYTADDYFKFCSTGTSDGAGSSSSLDSSAIPYAESRSFSDMRSELEANGVIPTIETHPLFYLDARYLDDGSLYCVELMWCRRSIGGLKDYSDLKVTAGREEVPIITDCISIEVDENGNVLEPAVTVTERDGIEIVAEGRESAKKSLTFQSENGWYQISGSWNDSYAAVIELLDWFWMHPIDFTQYPMNAGDHFTDSTLSETPGAFKEILPDFAAFGFVEESAYVSLKNGVPVRFEGHYVAHADAEKVKAQDYYDISGYTTMLWCVLAEPDVYDLDCCLGDIDTLTRDTVIRILNYENKSVKFMMDDLLVMVYPDNAAEAWELIESLQRH